MQTNKFKKKEKPNKSFIPEVQKDMEVEVGLKITRTTDRDNLLSTTNLRITKNPFDPLFLSKETDTKFILTIHIKGFKRENIEIEINPDGNRIMISGEKPVQEMVMVKWIMWKKDAELRVFKKVFRIPKVVSLDRIKAKFHEDESILTITMPKKVKGIYGLDIEEETNKTEESGDIQVPETKNESLTDYVPEKDETQEPKIDRIEGKKEAQTQIMEEIAQERESEEKQIQTKPEELTESEKLKEPDKRDDAEPLKESDVPEVMTAAKDKAPEPETVDTMVPEHLEQLPDLQSSQQIENEKAVVTTTQKAEQKVQDLKSPKPESSQVDETVVPESYEISDSSVYDGAVCLKEKTQATDEVQPYDDEEDKVQEISQQQEQQQKEPNKGSGKPKRTKLCGPLLIAGPAFLASLILIAVQFIRSKKNKDILRS